MPKKKAAPADNTLWIGLAVGGAVVVIIIIAGAVGVYVYSQQTQQPQAAVRPDNAPPPAPPPQPPPQPPPAKDIGEKKRAVGNIRLRAERPKVLNDLGQIKLFYMDFGGGTRPPRTAEEFTESIAKHAPALKQAIDEKYYVILPNVRSGIIAYERDPDTNNMHAFIDTMGGAREISTQELLQQLKAQGSQ
jgi:hypothetical protein